jgi:hypothetical protein
MDKKHFTAWKACSCAGTALALLLVIHGAEAAPRQTSQAVASKAAQATEGNKFYCNVKALSPEERAHHKEVTDKLIAGRREIVETPRGYEFQFSPATVSVLELAEWVTTEEKCCPFFYFHIDLEKEGTLVCLGLTGEEGIKASIRTEFKVPEK